MTKSGSDLLYSIVIPTYNRHMLVGAAIDSALEWLRLDGRGELIVVDDASTDGTAEMLARVYEDWIRDKRLHLIRSTCNLGVTGAKNLGSSQARGRWLIFLDSDDCLLAEACRPALATLEKEDRAPFVFFRCVSAATGQLIGPPQSEAVSIELSRYLRNWPWGECLPAVRREAHARHNYPADLRGFEGLAYAAQMKQFGPGIVSPVVARRYDDVSESRLSVRQGFTARAFRLARGHWRLLRLFPGALGVLGVARQLAKVAYYIVFGMVWRADRSISAVIRK